MAQKIVKMEKEGKRGEATLRAFQQVWEPRGWSEVDTTREALRDEGEPLFEAGWTDVETESSDVKSPRQTEATEEID